METFIDEAIKAAAALIIPVIAGYVVLVLHRLAKKFGLQVSAEQELKVRAGVQNILLGIEEAARAAVKSGRTAPSNTAKLNSAATAIVSDDRLPIENREEAVSIINQELPKVRAAMAVADPQPGTAA